ncbi:MAG: S8 family serine peptidase [Deferribacteraceae bacterium]|nr:S8 family serine peptidase [Deferribacteraceae bacterium]
MKKFFLAALLLLFAAASFAESPSKFASETGRYLVPVKKSSLKAGRESVCVLEQCYYIVDKISAERSVMSGEAKEYYPEVIRRVFAAPNDSYFQDQWALQNSAINWLSGWEIIKDLPSTGSIPVVAVIDSGIAEHDDLLLSALCGGEAHEAPYVFPVTNGFDEEGHGTHVAGIIGAFTDNYVGVASVSGSKVRVMSIRAATPCSDGTSGCLSSPGILDAIDQVLNKKMAGAPIVAVNMSFGSDEPSKPEFNAIKELRDHGILAVAAAGNGDDHGVGQNLNNLNTYPAKYDLQNIITVAAVDNGLSLASYSNYGNIVGIAAPGGGGHYSPAILSLGHTYSTPYASMSGTSMAAPFIAGLLGAGVALYNKDKGSFTYPDITPAQLINILYSTASAGSFGGKIENNRLVDVNAFFQKMEVCRDDAINSGSACPQAADTYPSKTNGFIPSGSDKTLTPPVTITYDPANDPCAAGVSLQRNEPGHDFGGCSLAAGDKGGVAALLLFLAIPLYIAVRRRLGAGL